MNVLKHMLKSSCMSSSLLRYNDFQLVRTSKIRGIGENTGEKMEIYLVPGNTTGSERTFLEPDMLKTLRKRKEDTYRSSCSNVGRCLVQLAEETFFLYISFLYGAEIEVPIVLRTNHVHCFDNSGCLTASGGKKKKQTCLMDK